MRSHLYRCNFASVFQGSQNQLKEVWEEADGLDPEDFDPKTFFNLHGKSFTNLHLLKMGGMMFIHPVLHNLYCQR